MAWDRIGPFLFVRLSRAPALVTQQVVVRARPGVAGVRLQRTGVRGDPFVVESFVDALTHQSAQLLAAAYAEAVGGSAYSVTYGNVNYDTVGHRYFALGVEILETNTLLLSRGGVNGAGYAFLRARWELLPVRFATVAQLNQ